MSPIVCTYNWNMLDTIDSSCILPFKHIKLLSVRLPFSAPFYIWYTVVQNQSRHLLKSWLFITMILAGIIKFMNWIQWTCYVIYVFLPRTYLNVFYVKQCKRMDLLEAKLRFPNTVRMLSVRRVFTLYLCFKQR